MSCKEFLESLMSFEKARMNVGNLEVLKKSGWVLTRSELVSLESEETLID